jgi:hypothetical protein
MLEDQIQHKIPMVLKYFWDIIGNVDLVGWEMGGGGNHPRYVLFYLNIFLPSNNEKDTNGGRNLLA